MARLRTLVAKAMPKKPLLKNCLLAVLTHVHETLRLVVSLGVDCRAIIDQDRRGET